MSQGCLLYGDLVLVLDHSGSVRGEHAAIWQWAKGIKCVHPPQPLRIAHWAPHTGVAVTALDGSWRSSLQPAACHLIRPRAVLRRSAFAVSPTYTNLGLVTFDHDATVPDMIRKSYRPSDRPPDATLIHSVQSGK